MCKVNTHSVASKEGAIIMSRRKHARHTNDDAIRDLQAWQDHQYDPGYRANLGRLRLFSGNGHGRPAGRYLAYALAAEFVLMIVFSLAVSVGVPGRVAGLAFVCATVAVLIVMLGRLMQTPDRGRKRRAGGRR
jgi:hypothetical protein